jgi:protein-S-isoprenylcysteine O-methyltransferase Ste14
MPFLSTLITIVWVIFWIYWFSSAFRSKRNTSTSLQRWAKRGIPIRVLLLVLVLFFIRPTFLRSNTLNPSHTIYAEIIGAILFVLGLSLAIWARLYLGENWGMPMTLKVEPELVTSGPYRFVRHPIYSGILIAILGTALSTNIVLIFVMCIAGIYFIYSAHIEERNMLKIFPKTYPDYKRRTKMLLPFIF